MNVQNVIWKRVDAAKHFEHKSSLIVGHCIKSIGFVAIFPGKVTETNIAPLIVREAAWKMVM